MTSTATTGQITLDIQSVDVLSHAMAHNGLAVVGQVRITNGPDVGGALLRIGVRDAQGDLAKPCEVVVDLARGEATIVREIPLVLDPATMAQVEEQRPGRVVAELVAPSAATMADGAASSAGSVTGAVAGSAPADDGAASPGAVAHTDAVVTSATSTNGAAPAGPALAAPADEVLSTASRPVQILAANQWLRSEAGVSSELLASFVMPNHPAVGALLTEAATILAQRTGSPSLPGYQSGPERVDAVARAIYEAMQARSIRYAEPPASWSDSGQKVRNPGEVLEGRVGTCLDTVVVMAAALEHAGIRPLLWIVQGHAFLGYWRAETSSGVVFDADASALVNLVDLGAIALVETTLVTQREEPVAFDATHRSPYANHLTGNLETVLGVVDVYEARRNGILPLPAHVRGSDGAVQVIEYRPAVHSHEARTATNRPENAQHKGRKPVPPRVQQWKNSLLDLSLRNKLIKFSDRASVALSVPREQLGRFEDLVNETTALTLRPADALDDVHVQRGITTGAELPGEYRTGLMLERKAVYCDTPTAGYQTRMRNLAYKARTIVEDTGANNLYLALGSLVWSIDGEPMRSPLVLVPVQLRSRARSGVYTVALDESGTSTPNFCLLEKLRQLHGLEVPSLAEPADDGSGIDLDAALESVRVAVAEAGLGFRVEPTADLAILQFAKFRLWKDLDENWEQLAHNPLVRHLIERPHDAFEDSVPAPTDIDLDELSGLCPIPADSSQLAAVADAVAGRTFVLEGPPGTGKSQTITNLVTRAVAEGRRVLFVAEKRAALDVVRRRLDEVGMGDLSLDLHDKGSKPAAVRAQIKQALELRHVVDEQGLAAHTETLRSTRRRLARYATELHQTNGAELSLYSARTQQLALADEPRALPVPAHLVGEFADAEALRAARRALELVPDVADPAQPRPVHAWGFVGLTDPTTLDATALGQACARTDRAVEGVRGIVASGGALAGALSAVTSATELNATVAIAPADHSLAVLDQTRSPRWQQAIASARTDLHAFVSAQHPGMALALPQVLDLPLDQIDAAAQAAAASGFFGRKKRLLAVLDQLRPGLVPDADIKPKQVPEVTAQLAHVHATARGLAARIGATPGLRLGAGWNPLLPAARESVERQVSWLDWAGGAVAPTHAQHSRGSAPTYAPPSATPPPAQAPPSGTEQGASGALRTFLSERDAGRAAPVDGGTHALLAEVAGAFGRLDALVGSGSAHVGEDTLAGGSRAGGLLRTWSRTAAQRDLSDANLVGARRWVAFLGGLEPLRTAGLDEARSLLRACTVHADDAVRAFDLGVAEASLKERAEATGLREFDPLGHGRTISRFTASATSVREHLASAIPKSVVERRPFDPEAGGRIGALRRELGRQRGGAGVRSLLSTYGELITQIMPYVLVSPDSLSRFFPAQPGLFDIVVFDEASQIRVADAVGVMGRASSVVVVGDSKQMPPTSFGEPLFDSGDGQDAPDIETTVEDEESILTECVQARVRQRWLSWHYRSKDESLIAFSNAQYYQNKLSSFPGPHDGRASAGLDGVGVSLVRVDGTFHRSGAGKLLRTNPVEAEAIVAEIKRRFATEPDGVPSVGVVTFNAQQRAFIEALLRDSGDERIIDALDNDVEGLFVKNLENVQGDERDVILFSTAFSVNDRGYLPLNFGPLNRSGGERRLNVAVTRARRQVIVFSSFDPEQLRAEQTSSLGIKHLRAYLDMAAHGTSTLAGIATSARRPSVADRHREKVAEVLRSQGLVVSTDVGLSDFKVDLAVALPSDPARPVMAVLLDGPGWARRGTVGDRDGLPVEVLSRMMRWPAVERLWLPAWMKDPAGEASRLVAAAHAAAVAPVGSPAAGDAATADDDSAGDDAFATWEAAAQRATAQDPAPVWGAALPMPAHADSPMPPHAPGDPANHALRGHSTLGAPTASNTPVAPTSGSEKNVSVFMPWDRRVLGTREVLDQLPSARAAAKVQRALESVVEQEGPVHAVRLAKLVANSFGLTKVSESRVDTILRVLPAELRARSAESFVWPRRLDSTKWDSYRTQDSLSERPLEHISLREIGNAMVALADASAGMEREELLRATLGAFGGTRLTDNIRARLATALDAVVEHDRISERDGYFAV